MFQSMSHTRNLGDQFHSSIETEGSGYRAVTFSKTHKMTLTTLYFHNENELCITRQGFHENAGLLPISDDSQ
jgi:hypothetical protein